MDINFFLSRRFIMFFPPTNFSFCLEVCWNNWEIVKRRRRSWSTSGLEFFVVFLVDMK